MDKEQLFISLLLSLINSILILLGIYCFKKLIKFIKKMSRKYEIRPLVIGLIIIDVYVILQLCILLIVNLYVYVN